MKFSDYSPSTSPSLEQQRDALRKGLGRAVQWAEAGCLADGPLLSACLTDQRFDQQVEESRTDWLWQMIVLLDAKSRFRKPFLHALRESTDERSAYQLCELGGRYAQSGDEEFRNRLDEIVETRPVANYPGLGESELLRLDGHQAFTFAARLRGVELADREWDWQDGNFVDKAVELLGGNEVRKQLDNTNDEAVRRFRDRWAQAGKREVRPTTKSKFRKRMRAISVSDILTESSKEKPSPVNFRGWGMHATDAELERVLERIWASTSPTEVISLLRVFSNRALPKFDRRLIELCHHANDDVRNRAFVALEKNADLTIREFALQRLHEGDSHAFALFGKNYEPGDEYTILERLELPGDESELHWLLLDVIEVLENNPAADASELGVVAYALTPCGTCRQNAARRLLQQRVAPAWLVEECRFDSDDECRMLIAASTPEGPES